MAVAKPPRVGAAVALHHNSVQAQERAAVDGLGSSRARIRRSAPLAMNAPSLRQQARR